MTRLLRVVAYRADNSGDPNGEFSSSGGTAALNEQVIDKLIAHSLRLMEDLHQMGVGSSLIWDDLSGAEQWVEYIENHMILAVKRHQEAQPQARLELVNNGLTLHYRV